MLIRSADFKGQIPRRHARLLPANYAQTAINTRLEDGTIGPVREPTTAHTFDDTPETFLKFAGSFISFDQPNVKATVGPVADDRLYYTGDGAPKMRVSGTDYALALSSPTSAPTVTLASEVVGTAAALATVYVSPPAADSVDEAFAYRYSAITSRGETVASAYAQIDRIDGERVTLGSLGLPSGTEKIRVYRLDLSSASGAAGRYGKLFDVEYDFATHGALNNASVTDLFEVFPDVSIAPVEEGDDVAAQEVVTYVYTYVTSFDEESGPSPASELVKVGPTDSVTYTPAAPSQTGRNIDRIRVYRSKTSLAGVTDFYFLEELAVAQGGVAQSDDFQQQLNEPIPSADNAPPPADMEGLIALPNGLMAAFSGREVLFCEPYKPHSWPIKYRMTTDTDIVGLGAFGTFLVVLTNGSPFLIQGSDPSLMVSEKMEVTLPCPNALSIVDMGYSVAFASLEGLVLVTTNGANVVTRDLFTDEQWRLMDPSTFKAEQRNGRYHFSYLPSGASDRKFGIIDVSREQPYFIEGDIEPDLLYYDPPDGALYFTEGGAAVKRFDPRGTGDVAKQTWRSKRTVLQGPDNFGAILVETDDVPGTKATPADPDCIVRVYADGSLIHTMTETNRPLRLPSGFLAVQWEVEIEGYAPVTSITLASDIGEIGGN